jgi:hypothetical protein
MPTATNRPAASNNRRAPIAARSNTSPASTSPSASRADLRSMSYSEGRNSVAPTGPTLGSPSDGMLTTLFARIDKSGDQGIDRKEVISHLKAVGIAGGLFGMVHKTVASTFIDELDTNNDDKVTWQEFRAVAAKVMPADLFDANGQFRPELVDEVFSAMDRSGDGSVDKDEFESAALDKLPEDTSHRGTKADVSAKLGLDALDLDKSGGVTRAELLKAAKAVAALR